MTQNRSVFHHLRPPRDFIRGPNAFSENIPGIESVIVDAGRGHALGQQDDNCFIRGYTVNCFGKEIRCLAPQPRDYTDLPRSL